MEALLKSDLRPLVNHAGGPCVSLYLATQRSGPETQQDPIRLKKPPAHGGIRLAGRGAADCGNQPAASTSTRVAGRFRILAAPGRGPCHPGRTRSLPPIPPPTVRAGTGRHRRTLSPEAAASLDRGQRAIRCTRLDPGSCPRFSSHRESMVELERPDLPGTLTLSLRNHTPVRQLQCHSVASAFGRRVVAFHGQGGGDEEPQGTFAQMVPSGG